MIATLVRTFIAFLERTFGTGASSAFDWIGSQDFDNEYYRMLDGLLEAGGATEVLGIAIPTFLLYIFFIKD